MYLTGLFAPSPFLIAWMRQPPAFHNLVTLQKIRRILSPPHLIAHPFALLLTGGRPAAFLTLAYPEIDHKISPTRHTRLLIKQFKLSHERSLTDRKKTGFGRDLLPKGPTSQSNKNTDNPQNLKNGARTTVILFDTILVAPYTGLKEG